MSPDLFTKLSCLSLPVPISDTPLLQGAAFLCRVGWHVRRIMPRLVACAAAPAIRAVTRFKAQSLAARALQLLTVAPWELVLQDAIVFKISV